MDTRTSNVHIVCVQRRDIAKCRLQRTHLSWAPEAEGNMEAGAWMVEADGFLSTGLFPKWSTANAEADLRSRSNGAGRGCDACPADEPMS